MGSGTARVQTTGASSGSDSAIEADHSSFQLDPQPRMAQSLTMASLPMVMVLSWCTRQVTPRFLLRVAMDEGICLVILEMLGGHDVAGAVGGTAPVTYLGADQVAFDVSRNCWRYSSPRISLYRQVDGKARSVAGSKKLGDESMDIETFRRGDNTWFLFGPICALMVLQCAETLDSLIFYSRLSSAYYLQSIWQSLGGCNVAPMVAALDDPELAPLALRRCQKQF